MTGTCVTLLTQIVARARLTSRRPPDEPVTYEDISHCVSAVELRDYKQSGRPWLDYFQPYRYLDVEQNVRVGPSAVSGLGLYTTRKILEGELVGYYSGDCVSNVKANRSRYIIQVMSQDDDGTYKTWFLDARSAAYASCRYINDACDYTPDEWRDVPRSLKTLYYTNCKFHPYMPKHPHPILGFYIPVYAICDIEPHAELFCKYGEEYWNRQRYSIYDDPTWMKGKAYDRALNLKQLRKYKQNPS